MNNTVKTVGMSRGFEKYPTRFALIIGAMKSGTTSLFEILSQHPQICGARVKEPDYFIKSRDDELHKNYLNLWSWKAKSHLIALESSVSYTKAPFITGVPERISKSGLGEFRFIYVLREPISRIESQARHGLFAGWGKSLDAGITDDLIDFSRYAMQIDNYLKYFPKSSMLLIVLEEFRSNPHAMLRQICEFLEVDDSFEFHDVNEPRNSGSFFNTRPVVARVTQGGLGQFVVKRILPVKIKKWLRNFIAKRNEGNEEVSNLGRWKLTVEEREYILRVLGSDLKRLESEYGIDVRSHWKIPAKFLGEGF